MPTENKSMASVFGDICSRNAWRSPESVSGPGSTAAATAAIRDVLPHVFRRHGVRSITDVPCGDFNWMSKVDLAGIEYRGFDVVESVVATCRERYSGPGVEFGVLDLVAEIPPAADLLLCRDCLVHLRIEDAAAAVENIAASGSRLLAATTFTALKRNSRGSTGGWRPLNLELSPFGFPKPKHVIYEGLSGKYVDKAIGVWFISDIATALQEMK